MKVSLIKFKKQGNEFLSAIATDEVNERYVESIIELRKEDSLEEILYLLSREVTKLVNRIK